MDVTISEGQQAISDLAGRILAERLPAGRLRELDGDPDWFARDVWAELARADLLGVCLPEAVGGGGYGMFGAALLLEQVGRNVAPVPLLATLVLGAMAVAEFGDDDQRGSILRAVIAGDLVVSGAALVEPGDPLPPAVPATSAAARSDGGWTLDGEKVSAPAAHLAGRLLVPARTGQGRSTVFLVDPAAEGVSVETVASVNDEPMGRVRLDGVAVGTGDVLGPVDGGEEVVAWITDRAIAGLCAIQAGVCEGALRTTATYTSEREQFGAKIATFQAVAHRAADAYIATEAVRLTAWQAAWRLDDGRPAAEALAIAKLWAADGASRVVHAAQHLHGGIGVDVDYPVHRYFRWAKHQELLLGGAAVHLRRLGDLIAEPA